MAETSEPAPRARWTLAAALLAVALAASAIEVPNDLYWHLAIAREIVTRGFPRHDPLAFSTDAIVWSPPEWLGELAYGAAYAIGGLGGTLALTLIAIGAIYALLTRITSRLAAPVPASLALIAFAWPASVHLPMRPLVLGHVLMLVLLERLFALREGDARGLRALPLLFALWSNVHPSWPVGLAILALHAIVLLGGAPLAKLGLVVESLPSEARRTLLAVTIVSPLATLLRPDGIDGALYPFVHVIGLGDRMREIIEWFPPDLAAPVNLALVALLAASLIVLRADRTRVPALDLALVLLGAGMALRYQRFLPLASFLATPVLARGLGRTRLAAIEARPALASVAVALAFVTLLLRVPTDLDRARDASFPIEAVRYAATHPVPARAFNTFEDGGYLLFSLPERQVFIDSRFDLYARAGVFDDYLALRRGQRIAEIVARYGLEAAFVPTPARDENFVALERALPDLGFVLVHEDPATHLWVRETRGITSLHP